MYYVISSVHYTLESDFRCINDKMLSGEISFPIFHFPTGSLIPKVYRDNEVQSVRELSGEFIYFHRDFTIFSDCTINLNRITHLQKYIKFQDLGMSNTFRIENLNPNLRDIVNSINDGDDLNVTKLKFVFLGYTITLISNHVGMIQNSRNYERRVVGVMTSFGSREGIHLESGKMRIKFPKDTFFLTRIGSRSVEVSGRDTGLTFLVFNGGDENPYIEGNPYIEIFGEIYLFRPFLNYEPLKRAIGLV